MDHIRSSIYLINGGTMEQEHSKYIGDIIYGLSKEAAFWKSKCQSLELEIEALKKQLEDKTD